MTVKRKIIYIVVLLVVIVGALFWQFNKKRIIEDEVQKAVNLSTDSLYTIQYDSSSFDEVAGSASFFNLQLRSDSMMEQVLTNDTTSARSIINLSMQALHITGLDVPSFLQKHTLTAKNIELIEPIIKIISSGKAAVKFERGDSLELYQRIIGDFKKIVADNISIKDALVLLSNGKEKPHTEISDLSLNLKNFVVDSTRNYDNIVSYFVKDMIVNAREMRTVDQVTGNKFLLSDIEYNAPKRIIGIKKFTQQNASGKELVQLNNNRISGISTDAFVRFRKVLADSLVTSGGFITMYRDKRNQSTADEKMEIENAFFDRAQVKNVVVGSTTLTVLNKQAPSEPPMVIKNARFSAKGIQTVDEGDRLSRIILQSKWKLSAAGYSFLTKDKMYRIDIGPTELDKENQVLKVNTVKLVPQLSESAFMARQQVQTDRYDLSFSDLVFKGVDVGALTNNRALIAREGSVIPNIKVYNDRTLAPSTVSKVGNYPHQMLRKVAMQVYVGNMRIRNGYVEYKERAAISKQPGIVYFTKINGSIANLTNVKERIAANPNLVLNATGKFLGVADLSTKWILPMNADNGAFDVSGTIGTIDAVRLNRVTEPLGLARINEGRINKLTFNMEGDDLKAEGRATILYDNLKVRVLKEEDGDLKRRGLISTVANIFLKDDNPSGGKTRTASFTQEREINKSFFNLVWKGIFTGVKKIAMGKSD